MAEEYHLEFSQLLSLCEKKILAKVPSKSGPVQGAFNGGDYLGRPGKDIFFALPKLTKEQMLQLADIHSNQYPFEAPNNHVGFAACIRYIYGQFEKQGILRSEEDSSRMQKDGVDWSRPRVFLDMLKNKFVEKNNYYGLCIWYEMEAHRLGDEGFLYKDHGKIVLMEETYMKSAEYAYRCNSLKQMFTPYYWAFRYFEKLENHDKALSYSIICLSQMEKYCPSPKQGYAVKAEDCCRYIKKNHPGKWKELSEFYNKNSKNNCVKNAVKAYS